MGPPGGPFQPPYRSSTHGIPRVIFARGGNKPRQIQVWTLDAALHRTTGHGTTALANNDHKRRFELLALPHLDAAFNLARWLTGNATDAEDVVQNAYMRAFRYIDAYKGGNFRVWLLTIVRNCFMD